jgi:hypothetical protein
MTRSGKLNISLLSVMIFAICFFIKWDLSGKYDEKYRRNEDNNANYELCYTNSFCVILVLSSGLVICAKSIDERVFLLKEDEIPK